MGLFLIVCVGKKGIMMDLTLTGLLLVMLMSSSPCHGDLRDRDLDVKDTEEEMAESSSSIGSGSHVPVSDEDELDGTAEPQTSWQPGSPPLIMKESSKQASRTGNWCAYVHRQVVSTAELVGTKRYAVNPCSVHEANCQISKGQIFSQPVYRQKQKILTALQWKCCPGHGGHNCQQRVNLTEAETRSSQEQPEPAHTDVSGVIDSGDKLETDLMEDGGWDAENPVQQSGDHASPVPGHFGGVPAHSLPFMDSISLLSAHQIFAAIMAELQPVLEGFNHTLKHLSSEVEDLSRDFQKLRHEQENVSKTRQDHLENSENKVEQAQTLLDSQQKQIEETVQLQKRFQRTLMNLKEDIDHHINQSHEEIQGRLESLTESVEEIQLDHEKLQETIQKEQNSSADLHRDHSALVTSVLEAVSILDKKVLNNTMELSILTRDTKNLTNVAHSLDHGLTNLSQTLEVSQSSEIYMAETGLEVEAARMARLKNFYELSTNLSMQERKLREIELDVDNIYQHLQNHEPSTAEGTCNCKEISDSLIRLELDVANVTDLAKENWDVLKDAEARRGLGHWKTEVEDLHQGLMSVKESLAFEQANRRTINAYVSQLKTSLLDCQQEIVGLKEQFVDKAADVRRLSASFSSLLNDAIRHSEVLEVLLGDEVMEFSRWSDIQQKEMAIPALLQRLQVMQQKIDDHESDLASLKRSSPEKDRMTNDDPVAFTEWSLPKHRLSNSDSFSRPPLNDEDYSVSDFWSLRREVEELADRVKGLEQQQRNCTATPGGLIMELQSEITSLRRAHEAHLRTFKNLFSYTEDLASSSGGVDLDLLWTMTRRKDRKRKKGQTEKDKKAVSIRRRRTARTGPSDTPVAFITSLHHRTGTRGGKVVLNHGDAYSSSSGAFEAPHTGLYLFLVTLDCNKGPFLAQLKRGDVPVVSFRQEDGGLLNRACLLELEMGECVTLELVTGTLNQVESDHNTLTGMLLFNTDKIIRVED